MSRRTVVLVVAVLLAGIAAFSVWRYLDTVESDIRADVSEVFVYRATQLIEAGTDGATAEGFIELQTALAEDVDFEGSNILCPGPATESAAEDACVNNPSNLEALLAGTVAAGPISVGQLITTDLFAAPTELEADNLSAEIPAEKVAVAIDPGGVGAVGGHIQPGDHVNVLASTTVDQTTLIALLADPVTRELVIDTGLLSGLLTAAPPVVEPEDEDAPPPEVPDDPLTRYLQALPSSIEVTQTILQDVPVLAIGPRIVGSPAVEDAVLGEAVVVLDVTAAQAERLEWARLNTTLGLALLPADEPYTEFAAEGAQMTDIFDLVERLLNELEGIDGG